jgi:flagellar protein FlgJ
MGGAALSPSTPLSDADRPARRPVSALSAPTTPGNRMPKVDRSKVDPTMLQAAEGMEAMFLDLMMKAMRKTVPKSDMDLESPATEIYRGMLDAETVQKAAHSGGVGLADQIVAYLEGRGYTGKTGEPAAPVGRDGSGPDRHNGGAHENR